MSDKNIAEAMRKSYNVKPQNQRPWAKNHHSGGGRHGLSMLYDA